jgi:c-di-AMP phosphodiesterase-like protein
VKYKATEQFGLLDEGEMYEDAEGNMKQFVLYDNLSEFIQTYEAKKNEKKKTKLKVLDKFLEETVLDEQLPDKL